MPLRVCSFESRRAAEMQSLIERHGAEAVVVPSMREVPLDSNREALAFAEALAAGQFDVVVFLTGVGARTLLEVVEPTFGREKFLDALRRTQVAVRGPKPVAVLREWNVPIAIRAVEPNTWRELIAALDAAGANKGRRLAVQEYGRPNRELVDELSRRGASVTSVPVYKWTLPESIAPLESAIRDTIAGRFDVLLFTSAHQVDNVLEVAGRLGPKAGWINAARRTVIGSIGPTTSEALSEAGLQIDVEASPTRMGQLVVQTLRAAPRALHQKEPRTQ